MHVVDELFGLDFLSPECANFIIDMLKLKDAVLNADFVISSDGGELIVGEEATGIKTNRHFEPTSWRACKQMRSRINRELINTFENALNDEFDRLMFVMLKDEFNYFVLTQ